MRANINWKVLFILLLLSIIGLVSIVPYTSYLIGKTSGEVSIISLLFNQVAQGIVTLTPVILVGLVLAKRIGFGLPFIESLIRKKKNGKNFLQVLKTSVFSAFMAVLLVVIFDFLFIRFGASINVPAEFIPPLPQRLLASLYSGINEEIIYRLFIMSFVIWVAYKIKSTKGKKATRAGIYIGIIVSSLFFAFSHLPIGVGFIKLTPLIISRVIVVSGVAGSIYGYTFYKWGLESAMITHFITDFILQLIP